MNSSDYQRSQDLHSMLSPYLKRGMRPIAKPKPRVSGSLRYSVPLKALTVKDGAPGRDGSPDTGEQIAEKLNLLKDILEPWVIKDFPKLDELIAIFLKELKDPKGKNKLEYKDILNAPQRNPLDMRWHGAGISSVSHDATMTGTCMPASPLSVVPIAGATWYNGEQITIAGDNKTFTLAHAPTQTIFLYSGHQPQQYGVDFTGTINGVNKIFVYANTLDPFLLSDQFATYS